MDAAFRAVDGLDTNGSSGSFLDAGEAGQVFRGMLASKAPPPYYGAEIARAATARAAADRTGYEYARSPTSPLPDLSGNSVPGVTRPSWLEGKNKCNQFVGDVLTQAGIKAPTVSMADGSKHYGRAETWHGRTDLFNRVTSASDIRPGDVIVRDDTSASGAGTAHIEVVTGLNPMRTTGAHDDGAYEEQADWLAGAAYNRHDRSWTRGTDEIYVLRPKARVGE